jgi:uncharacterized protein
VQFVKRPLPIARLPADLHGRLLMHISDLHVGPRVDDDYLMRTLDRAAALRPDFVVFTGDFVSYDVAHVVTRLGSVLQHFPHGSLGTVAILGNHDYGPAWSHPEIAAEVARTASAAGITVLRNDATMCSGLQIVGLDDLWAGRYDSAGAFAAMDSQAATLVLTHNPDTVDLPGWESYAGWILAGHTHGGQCKPPFLPPPLLPVRNRRYTAGAFALSGERRLYINRAVGHLLRVRFNVRPEITLFRLQRA